MKRKILFVTRACYLDHSNGAAVASRSMMQALQRRGYPVEALSGTATDLADHLASTVELAARYGLLGTSDLTYRNTASAGAGTHDAARSLRLSIDNVPVTLSDEGTAATFLSTYDGILSQFRPDVIAGYGGDPVMQEVFARARASGIATVFFLHNFQYERPDAFSNIDCVCVPSRFAADYYDAALGLKCVVLPNLVDRARCIAVEHSRRYLVFVNPSPEKGVWPFTRIADELGRLRPDIPVLIVEARGTEETLASCGLDLRTHGTVFLMSHTHDPKKFWRHARLCVMPSLWWESQPLVAIEALLNGVPVIGSDRGGIPETLGNAGVLLSLPDRLSPVTRSLPTADEVAPWVQAIIRLWDDPEEYGALQRRAFEQCMRWDDSRVEPLYEAVFDTVSPGVVCRAKWHTDQVRERPPPGV